MNLSRFNGLVSRFEEIAGSQIQDDMLWEEYFIEFAKANGFVVLVGPDQYTSFVDGDILLCPDEHPGDLYFVFEDGYLNEVVQGNRTLSRITQVFFFQRWNSEDDIRHYMFRECINDVHLSRWFVDDVHS